MALVPGSVPLTLIRGTQFSGIVLECKDGDITVTGTLSPDVTGAYEEAGSYNGYPMFVLEGSPSTFIFVNTFVNPAGRYVIGRTLTDGDPVNYWQKSNSNKNDVSGTYSPNGAYTGTATVTDHPTDLTGYTAQAEVRRTPKGETFLNLNPSVTDPTGGEITIPSIDYTVTAAITFTGLYQWDLVPVNGSGQRLNPIIQGTFTISDNITQP
jgi:hypothetical protein